jgi:DNA mismatch repair ATPase MutS
MSGKSTWLRTVGLLHVLAFAGAPVRARTLRLSRLTLGASIRIQDSLHSGVSHFAAEVQRLKQIVDLTAQDGPVLYLVDEVLQGTNSHDRRVGTEAVLHKLLSRGAVGLITTHDLALTEMAEALGSRVANVHFQDRVIDGMMVFDYRVHPGVIERSNALDLMRAAGLEV